MHDGTAPRAADPELLEPSVRAIVARLVDRTVPIDDAVYVRALRENRENPFGRPGPGLASVADVIVAAPDGRPIACRLYRARLDAFAPTLVWFHGGGFVFGSLETHDAQMRTLASLGACNVLAVDYRLAPEAPYPAAIEDAYAVLVTVGRDPARFGTTGSQVAIGGDSAGGNIATVTTMVARDRGGPPIALQVLVYPDADARAGLNRASWRAYDGFVLERTEKDRILAMYLPHVDRTIPYVSPALASLAALRDLPRALVVTAGCDPQRDEAEDYVGRLRSAGVSVAATRYAGMIHGFMRMDGALASGRDVLVQIAEAVRSLGL